MLHLQARVHLQEVEVAGRVQDELDRARVDVARLARQPAGARAHPPPEILIDGRRRGFLDDLLVAPLQRALALAQVDDGAVPVGHDLDLDVARRRDVLLNEDPLVAEGLAGFRAGGLHGGGQLVPRSDDAHAFAAAARSRLQ